MLMYQGPTGHRTTSFSVLDILDPNKFTSRRKQQLDAYGAEKRRGVTLETGMEPSKEEYQSESGSSAPLLDIFTSSFYQYFCFFIFQINTLFCDYFSVVI